MQHIMPNSIQARMTKQKQKGKYKGKGFYLYTYYPANLADHCEDD